LEFIRFGSTGLLGYIFRSLGNITFIGLLLYKNGPVTTKGGGSIYIFGKASLLNICIGVSSPNFPGPRGGENSFFGSAIGVVWSLALGLLVLKPLSKVKG
jgi:hypothetical protein